MYGEDVDLSIKNENIGLKCYYIPKAKLWHYMSASYGGNHSFTKIFQKFILYLNYYYINIKKNNARAINNEKPKLIY